MAERLSEKFEIRPWQEGDDLALLEIWNSARNEVEERQRGLFGPDTDAPFSRTLVVTVSGVPVAAGTVVASLLHPTRLWSYVVPPCWMRCVRLRRRTARRLLCA